MKNNFEHITVLKNETVMSGIHSCLSLSENSEGTQRNIIDCTLGGGGHTEHFISTFFDNSDIHKNDSLQIFGFDQDTVALAAAQERLQPLLNLHNTKLKFVPVHANFSDLRAQMEALNLGQNIDAVLADLGVSSPQLDEGSRGFSFRLDGPLDMRMNSQTTVTAKEILLHSSESELISIFSDFGEEPKSKKMAKAICQDRTIKPEVFNNTLTFAQYAKAVLCYPEGRTHPATRVFQALRIAVNRELEALDTLLDALPFVLKPNGVAAFITFHSLEDRRVKQRFRAWEKGFSTIEELDALPDDPFFRPDFVSWGKEKPRGGITASDVECKKNPRSRSARLRSFYFNRAPSDGFSKGNK